MPRINKSSVEKRFVVRFRLRTLLIVTSIACLGLGLIGHSLSKARKEQRAISELVTLGAGYDDWIGWREVFGENYRPIVQVDLPVNLTLDEAIEHLVHLDNLESLSLSNNTTDLELVQLEKVYWLRSLNLSGTDITDAGLKHLAQLRNLNFLHLEETTVSDKAVLELRRQLPGCKIIQ